jgi:type II secretory pathway component PulC
VPGVTEEEIRDQSNGQLWFHSFIAQPVYKKGAYAGMGFNPNLAYQQDYGIKPGDMLTAINGLPVERPGDVDKLLHKVKGGTVTLSIERDGAPMTFTLKVDGP